MSHVRCHLSCEEEDKNKKIKQSGGASRGYPVYFVDFTYLKLKNPLKICHSYLSKSSQDKNAKFQPPAAPGPLEGHPPLAAGHRHRD